MSVKALVATERYFAYVKAAIVSAEEVEEQMSVYLETVSYLHISM